ncbi:hypothetical protein GCM10023258_17470 [Terrabacter aeriphilus]|uniref:Uncharacterized protein n=1 Tax=Terrabacter aeriphilus TaxID=515662 RepID=A0ABP9JAV4_9MICO
MQELRLLLQHPVRRRRPARACLARRHLRHTRTIANTLGSRKHHPPPITPSGYDTDPHHGSLT